MNWKISGLIMCWLVGSSFMAYGQYDPLHPPNTFRSSDNPFYWKNEKPHPGYWQQDVHYRIDAKIDETTHIIHGEEKLTYWNNSPDTLHKVYFHLYQNAFQPGSYYHQLWKDNKRKPEYGQYEKRGLGTTVDSLRVDGQQVETTLDNTLLRVELPEPLYPGESVEFTMDFKTYFDSGKMRRRMHMFTVFTIDTFDDKTVGHRFKHYNAVHWYPRISVYDRKFGWTTDQHLDKEFYGDFGTYDVKLTFPSNYIVGATGYLQNRDKMLPEELREKLDLKKFKDKPRGNPAYSVIPYDRNKHKTWVYHAENVHDFAFTADPTYRIGEAEWKGIKSYALARESNASRWQNAAEYTAKIIEVNSKTFGMYEYPKIIVADARDGMEYPMITLDAGGDPGYRDLLIHEVSHMWFFGMLGNNEAYRASMDEGFTQFATAHGYNEIDGKYYVQKSPPDSWYKRIFKEPRNARDGELYFGYEQAAIHERDYPLNTHSSDFHGALRHGGGYGLVYYKFGTMLYNLQYVLGDSLFFEAMRHYVDQWKMAHPYFDDFRRSIINYTDVDLNWFFDQWLETTKKIDYAIKSVKRGKEDNAYIIEFERKGAMQMPIDFTVTDKEGKKHQFHIPNTWFVKETDAKVLPKWYGWGKRFNTTYEAEVTVPNGIKNIRIDTTDRLADINMLNNSKKCPIDFKFDSKVQNLPDWRTYSLKWRPDAWYNSYDGVKAGLHFEGDYMNHRHIFSATAWYNTGVLQGGVSQDDFGTFQNEFDKVSFNLHYKTALDEFSDYTDFIFNAKSLDGLHAASFGFKKQLSSPFALDQDEVYLRFNSMYRPELSNVQYLLYPDEWGVNQFNNYLTLGYRHRYQYHRGLGNINLQVRSSALFSNYDYTYASVEVKNKTRLLNKLLLNTRVYSRMGTGNEVPSESALYMAGANPESLMENKYTRAKGIFPTEWAGYGAQTNHFHHGGGLNLRGYSGYFVVQDDEEGGPAFVYKGRSGSAVNAELEFDDLVNFNPRFLRAFRLDTYIFGDVGTISYTQPDGDIRFSDIRADAGVGAALTIRKWGPLETADPLTIRFDVPLFLNRPPAVEEYLQMRWVLGVKRAF